MGNVKGYVMLTGLLAILALVPVRYTDCASTATASQPAEECGWVCKNLKADWNYLFHPDRINQCKPRRIGPDTQG